MVLDSKTTSNSVLESLADENKMRFYFMPEKNGYADLDIHEVVLKENM